jgi:DNA-binding PucR family transcriptional regulator
LVRSGQTSTSRIDADIEAAVRARVAQVATLMDSSIGELTEVMRTHQTAEIPELHGDPLIIDLLAASNENNLQTITRILRYDMPLSEAAAPPAAVEYARRLAQRGISVNALNRAYRLGQKIALAWVVERIYEAEPDPLIGYRTSRVFLEVSFEYVDIVSEQVVHEYEAERARWLTNRNSVRLATIAEILAGQPLDVPTAEATLGYRLRQHHLGVVVWRSPDRSTTELRDLERFLAKLASALGSASQPLFVPQDKLSAWGWISLGRKAAPLAAAELQKQLDLETAGVRMALGDSGAGVAGFRTTHIEARSAYELALLAQDAAPPITSFAEPGVRAASLLAGDLDATRRLVSTALGGLALDTEPTARLRETFATFLGVQGSYAATAELMHLHKNTVKYRIAKAVEARGRPLDDDRLNLELALTACKWLGDSVLPRPIPEGAGTVNTTN